MTSDVAASILDMWSRSTGLADDRLGYMEGWFNKEDKAAFDLAIDTLKKSRWIPCSERLPDEEGFYLVSVASTVARPVRIYKYKPNEIINKDMNTWLTEDGNRCFNWFVLAWKPLPEEYK